MYRYLVDYTNADGQFRTYGGVGHLLEASSAQAAIDKLTGLLPPQVARTFTRIQVANTANL